MISYNLIWPRQNNGILVDESNNSGENHTDDEIYCAADNQEWNTAWKWHRIELRTQGCQACKKHEKQFYVLHCEIQFVSCLSCLKQYPTIFIIDF